MRGEGKPTSNNKASKPAGAVVPQRQQNELVLLILQHDAVALRAVLKQRAVSCLNNESASVGTVQLAGPPPRRSQSRLQSQYLRLAWRGRQCSVRVMAEEGTSSDRKRSSTNCVNDPNPLLCRLRVEPRTPSPNQPASPWCQTDATKFSVGCTDPVTTTTLAVPSFIRMGPMSDPSCLTSSRCGLLKSTSDSWVSSRFGEPQLVRNHHRARASKEGGGGGGGRGGGGAHLVDVEELVEPPRHHRCAPRVLVHSASCGFRQPAVAAAARAT